MNFITNPQLELAFDYVRNTDKNIFLTGKAGTGKTTFLHQIKLEGMKRMVVLAPTGVAAINAGGMTLHSFFQLPFGLHLPGVIRDESNKRRFSGQKISLIRSLDLLVIDEISMVRADMLDAVDEVLRRYRDYTKPFGGVQLLMIGDLHQLPPVVKHDEWELLSAHYQTPYFFGSLALQKTGLVTLELKHIYRQSDSTFISLLNRVRDNQMDAIVLETLNSRYIHNFQPKEEDAYITLTAVNAAAYEINAQRLQGLPEPVYIFKAKITDEFPPSAYPNEEILEFKPGAQVMFVKNDPSPEKQYFNGKIGKIVRIEDGEVHVRCPGDNLDIVVTTVDWDNVKYTLNETTKEIKEDVVGKFTQYPLKLAWAITIHKSQGLTFERAIIDAQAAFAHGQVYVALSRCKSFEGIVLRSKIGHSSVRTDLVVKNYSEEAEKNPPTEAQLKQAKREYQQTLMAELFSFKSLKRYFDQLNRIFREHESALTPAGFTQFKSLADKAQESVFAMADKFLLQLPAYFAQAEMPEENEALQLRIQKAGVYFSDKLTHELMPEAKGVQIFSDNKSLIKTAFDQLENLQKELFTKNACFKACQAAFSTQNYIRAKTNAELNFIAAKNIAPPPTSGVPGVPKSTPHHELYAQLLQWRDSMAAENGMENWEVLPVYSLRELVEFLPVEAATLKRIRGIGDAKLKRFGADIIRIIEKYCEAKNIPVNLMAAAAPPKPSKQDTKFVSFEMFQSGKTIEEIAAARNFVRTTIEGHLAHYVSNGELAIDQVMEISKIEEIRAFFLEKQTSASAEAKAHFGEKYSYGELKMVLNFMRFNGDEFPAAAPVFNDLPY